MFEAIYPNGKLHLYSIKKNRISFTLIDFYVLFNLLSSLLISTHHCRDVLLKSTLPYFEPDLIHTALSKNYLSKIADYSEWFLSRVSSYIPNKPHTYHLNTTALPHWHCSAYKFGSSVSKLGGDLADNNALTPTIYNLNVNVRSFGALVVGGNTGILTWMKRLCFMKLQFARDM